MGTAPQYIFPGAVLGSVMLALFVFMITAGMSLPVSLPAAAPLVAEPANVAAEQLSPGADSGEQVSEDCDISQKYPDSILQWCDLITHFSDTNNLEPDLIAALIWQESGGNPVAYSRSGAVGLMQVMPRDGLASNFQCPNGPCFVNRPSIAELQDPKFNIKYGTGMLAGLFNKYGDIREALKYYGPKDVGYYYADKVLGIFQNYKK